MCFSLGFSRGKLICSLIFFTQVIIAPLWLMLIFLSQARGCNIGKLETEQKKPHTQWQRCRLFGLTTLSPFCHAPFSVSLCKKTGTKTMWYAGRYSLTKTPSGLLSPPCWRHKVRSCQKYLTCISARLHCRPATTATNNWEKWWILIKSMLKQT